MIENHLKSCKTNNDGLRTLTMCLSCGAITTDYLKMYWGELYKNLCGSIYTYYHTMLLDEMLIARGKYVV